MNHVVGVSDAKCSNQREDVITTYALGSCIGVALYDPAVEVAGMLHFQLPSSSIDLERAKEEPLMYADTGMAVLLSEMARLGATKNRLRIRLAGGARMLNDRGIFDLGRRNHAAIRKVLWTYGMFIEREMVGGTEPMTMQLEVSNGGVVIKKNGQLHSL